MASETFVVDRPGGRRIVTENYVVNRQGVRVAVRFDNITDRNAVLCSLSPRLVYVERRLAEITQAVVARFQNGMTTHALDMLTAAVCSERSTHHLDYSALAARILVSNLHETTEGTMEELVHRLEAARDDRGEPAPRVSREFVVIVERAATAIENRLVEDRDFGFTCFGLQTMLRSYVLRLPDGTIAERPQHVYMRVSLGIHVCQPDGLGHLAPEAVFNERLERAFQTYELLSLHRLSHASPTMFNAGTQNPQLASCFLLSVDDSLETLLQVDKDAGLLSKLAGGMGVCLTPMRAQGALIRSTGGASSGVRRYAAKLNATQLYVNQGGVRPGAFAAYLETWHADVLTFLELGRFKDTVASEAPDLKYGLWVNDLFMEAVEAQLAATAAEAAGAPFDEAAGDWYLFSPDRAPGLADAHGAAFRALYGRYVAERRFSSVVKARVVLTEWFRTVAQKGTPYILFKDHINAKSNLSHVATITTSNLCVTGLTTVLTDQGFAPIQSLVGRAVRVWNGDAWSSVQVRQTAASAPLVRVTLNGGPCFDCTPYHKFYTNKGVEVPACDLAPGTLLERPASWPLISEGSRLPQAYELGRSAACLATRTRGVYLGPTAPFIGSSLKSRVRWLEGFCDGAAPGFQIVGANVAVGPRCPYSLGRTVQLMLQTMGCDSWLETVHAYSEGPARWQLQLKPSDLLALNGLDFAPKCCLSSGLGFVPKRWCSKVLQDPPGRPRWPARVLSVVPLDEPAPTYCFTEPLRHRAVFDGVLTGQCAEITIPCRSSSARPEETEYGTCTLGAIPLASYVLPDAEAENPGRVRINWKGLYYSAGIAIRNLDRIIDVCHYPVEAARRSNLRHRPVALGVMGLADVLARFGYDYGSEPARALDRALHATIYYGAMKASSDLGAKLGNFSTFEGSAAQRGLLQPDLWVQAGHLDAQWADEVARTTGGFLMPASWSELRAACRLHLRNGYVTADMPTATTSQVTGQNECFEPFTSNLYTRKTLAGEFTLLNPYLLRELEDRCLWDDDMRRSLISSAGSVQGIARIPADLRDRFRTAREIDQRLLTLHAKARNPFLSQSQSLNYFFGALNLKDVLSVLVLGWREGLTTGSYYIHSQPASGTQKTSIVVSAGGRPEGEGAPPACGRAGPECSSCSV